jgi:hypothetical protein
MPERENHSDAATAVNVTGHDADLDFPSRA